MICKDPVNTRTVHTCDHRVKTKPPDIEISHKPWKSGFIAFNLSLKTDMVEDQLKLAVLSI